MCKTEEQISNLLKGIYFNLYYVNSDVELGNPTNYGSSPLTVVDNFHSQF